MTNIYQIIEKSVAQTSIANIAFGRKKCLLLSLFLFISVLYVLANAILLSGISFFVCSVTYVFILIISFYTFINPYAKKRLTKRGIKVNNNWKKSYINQSLLSYRNEKLKKFLMRHKVIIKNNPEVNRKQLQEYINYFKYKTCQVNFLTDTRYYFLVFGILAIPIWHKIVEDSFDFSTTQHLESLSYIMFVVLIVSIFLGFIFYTLRDIFELKKYRLQVTIDLLQNLKWHETLQAEKLKLKQSNNSTNII